MRLRLLVLIGVVLVPLLAGRTGQYIHISTASIYHKPVWRVPFVESTARHNPYLGYARDKMAAEDVLRSLRA